MKKYLFLLTYIFLFACQSYDMYLEEYGKRDNLVETLDHFIQDNYDRYVENPQELLWDLAPIKIIPDENNLFFDYEKLTPSQKYYYDTYSVRVEHDKIYWECWSPKFMDSVARRIMHEEQYRANFLYGLMDDATFMIEGIVAFSYIGGNIPLRYSQNPSTASIRVNTAEALAFNAMLKGPRPNTLMAQIHFQNYNIKYLYGNRSKGLCHTEFRHYPSTYTNRGWRVPQGTNLFLESCHKTTLKLFRNIPNATRVRSIKTRGTAIGWEFKMTCPTGFERWYELIIKPNGEVITFYPSSKVPYNILGTQFPEYSLLVYKYKPVKKTINGKKHICY